MTKPPWVTEIGFKQRIWREQLYRAYSVTEAIDGIKADMLSRILERARAYIVLLQDYDISEAVERLEARLYIVNDIEALRRDYYELEMYRAGSTSGPKPPALVPTVCNCDDCRHNR